MQGFKIKEVYPGSPASELGLTTGCVITSVGGQDIKVLIALGEDGIKQAIGLIREAQGKFVYTDQNSVERVAHNTSNNLSTYINSKYKTTHLKTLQAKENPQYKQNRDKNKKNTLMVQIIRSISQSTVPDQTPRPHSIKRRGQDK
ncbi:hypothetical protein SZ25_00462 [Candidatus Arcanobacter lacustris]|uniref:Uncharacterized protein n=1 Tax=Candidatus Arcanibacter lacustris TaxID=1607817 RepID=A0A0F5MNP7_9RICK|nr:hypothetical protein SZ25_00462 [Candidatus Arcanobacter lacustris]